MQKKIKCLISILLSLIVIVSLATTAYAIQPRYSDTNSITLILLFSGTTANCDVRIIGADDTASITDVNITLKDSNNKIVGEWKNLSSTGKRFTFYDTVADLTKGETYTLYASAKVNRKSGVETVSEKNSQTCPNK